MNIQVQRQYGSQSMAAPLRRVLMRSAASAMRHAKPAEWHYGPGFDAARAASQHKAFADLVAASGRGDRMADRGGRRACRFRLHA